MLLFIPLYNQGRLEELIDALVEKEDIYLKMFPEEEKAKAHQKMINYIEASCNKVTEEYLVPAAGRHYKKKKIARSESGES